MKCPSCDHKARVGNSRPHSKGVKRRYVCPNCGEVFTTQEVRVPNTAMTVNTVEEYTPNELYLWRMAHSLSQKEAAAVLGVSRTIVSNMERGLTPVGLTITLACRFILERCKL